MTAMTSAVTAMSSNVLFEALQRQTDALMNSFFSDLAPEKLRLTAFVPKHGLPTVPSTPIIIPSNFGALRPQRLSGHQFWEQGPAGGKWWDSLPLLGMGERTTTFDHLWVAQRLIDGDLLVSVKGQPHIWEAPLIADDVVRVDPHRKLLIVETKNPQRFGRAHVPADLIEHATDNAFLILCAYCGADTSKADLTVIGLLDPPDQLDKLRSEKKF
jgi:hypothetical protein